MNEIINANHCFQVSCVSRPNWTKQPISVRFVSKLNSFLVRAAYIWTTVRSRHVVPVYKHSYNRVALVCLGLAAL